MGLRRQGTLFGGSDNKDYSKVFRGYIRGTPNFGKPHMFGEHIRKLVYLSGLGATQQARDQDA